MFLFHVFLYYSFLCSAVLFFGIGLNRSIQVTTGSLRVNFKVFFKSLISILGTSIFTFLITQYVLLPLKLEEMFPVIALFIFLCLNSFIEALVRITAKTSTSEFSISFLMVLLTIYESSSLLESLVIAFSCMISFLIM
ncbi:MAG: hypothetical protein HUK25_04570, partial [Treponema sp.]|nr:hypothetical protein [Treponema sp.]